MNKRGVTETQFNWIFIMVAGAIILLFFVSMVYKQKSVSEQKSDIEMQKNLQAILTGAEASKQTENIVSVPDKEIRYGCEGFSLGSLAAFNARVVFAPDLLKSGKRELIFYSLEWRVPFRITNFLYVTSPEARYIIVDDNDNLNDKSIANQLFDLLPENINKEIVSKDTTINEENNYKIKIVFFNKNNIKDITLNGLKGDISAINIVGNDIDKSDNIEFYDYTNNKFENEKISHYLKKESVIAAVFSENAEIYECNMKKAVERMKKVYKVYGERISKIKENKPDCSAYYKVEDLKPDFNDYEKIYNNIQNLENKNKAVELYSCPLIY